MTGWSLAWGHHTKDWCPGDGLLESSRIPENQLQLSSRAPATAGQQGILDWLPMRALSPGSTSPYSHPGRRNCGTDLPAQIQG